MRVISFMVNKLFRERIEVDATRYAEIINAAANFLFVALAMLFTYIAVAYETPAALVFTGWLLRSVFVAHKIPDSVGGAQ